MNDHINVLNTKPSKIVVFEGGIGVGKSTLIEILRDALSGKESGYSKVIVYKEPIAPKMLKAYLKNQKKYALIFQHNILLKLLNIYRAAKAIAVAQPGTLILIDRGIIGNRAFAKMQHKDKLFDDDDYNLYLEEIGAFDGSLDELLANPLFTTIYLRCAPEVAFDRMLKRGIEEEVNCYKLEYFKSLHDAHEELLATHEELVDRPTAITVDWNDNKCIENSDVQRDVVQTILEIIQ